MSRIRTYTTYTEVTNGLFIDIPNEEFIFLPDDLVTQFRPTLTGTASEVPSDREITFMTGVEGMRQFQRAMEEEAYRQLRISESRNRRTQNQRGHLYIDPSVEIREEEVRRASNEGIWHQLRNMSERETIQYLDRISQEQENEQHNSTI